uniref:Uncharacterized protein n=1 Tax=Glossina palpalis gambiensis TaxID=67801 RepID=A0A1B0AZQ0_9MUSC
MQLALMTVATEIAKLPFLIPLTRVAVTTTAVELVIVVETLEANAIDNCCSNTKHIRWSSNGSEYDVECL